MVQWETLQETVWMAPDTSQRLILYISVGLWMTRWKTGNCPNEPDRHDGYDKQALIGCENNTYMGFLVTAQARFGESVMNHGRWLHGNIITQTRQ